MKMEKNLEELIKKYQEEKQILADQITLSIEYNRHIDKQKINMVEMNDKMCRLNKKIKQANEQIKRENDKETETQKEVLLWIKNLIDELEKQKENLNNLQNSLKNINEIISNVRNEEEK